MSVRWGTVSASALLLALLLGAQSLRIHHDEERTEPIAASGAASAPVDAQSFTAEVVDVSFASAVAEEDPFDFDAGADAGGGSGADPGGTGGAGAGSAGGGAGSGGSGAAEEPGAEGVPAPADGAAEAIEANGVWVVVTVDITAAREHLDQVKAELDAGGGTVYTHNTWLTSALGSTGTGFPAGIPVRGSVLFEVPPGQLTAPELRLNAFSGLDRRLSGLAEIDLELSGSDLRSAVDGAEPALSVPPAAQQEV
ncbi:hypothetical protein [Nocardiopsis coralliicola]